MGEFQEQADEIARVISEKSIEKMDIAELTKITTNVVDYDVNCYPGIPGKCHKVAYFYSLTDKSKYRTKRGVSLSFPVVLEKIVSHMKGGCEDVTNTVILITDNWDANAYNKWKDVLEKIKKNNYMEIYLIVSNQCNRIEI